MENDFNRNNTYNGYYGGNNDNYSQFERNGQTSYADSPYNNRMNQYRSVSYRQDNSSNNAVNNFSGRNSYSNSSFSESSYSANTSYYPDSRNSNSYDRPYSNNNSFTGRSASSFGNFNTEANNYYPPIDRVSSQGNITNNFNNPAYGDYRVQSNPGVIENTVQQNSYSDNQRNFYNSPNNEYYSANTRYQQSVPPVFSTSQTATPYYDNRQPQNYRNPAAVPNQQPQFQNIYQQNFRENVYPPNNIQQDFTYSGMYPQNAGENIPEQNNFQQNYKPMGAVPGNNQQVFRGNLPAQDMHQPNLGAETMSAQVYVDKAPFQQPDSAALLGATRRIEKIETPMRNVNTEGQHKPRNVVSQPETVVNNQANQIPQQSSAPAKHTNVEEELPKPQPRPVNRVKKPVTMQQPLKPANDKAGIKNTQNENNTPTPAENKKARVDRMKLAGEAALRAQGFNDDDVNQFMNTGRLNAIKGDSSNPAFASQSTARLAVLRQAKLEQEPQIEMPAVNQEKESIDTTQNSQGKKANSKHVLINILEWVIVLVVAIAAAFAVRTFVFSFYRVLGSSMEPLLSSGERVFVNKIGYKFNEIERFDVIVCHYPGSDDYYVKRVVALPGDTVSVDKGQVYVNDSPLNETYVEYPDEVSVSEIKLEDGQYMVMGDNRADSYDSRDIGPISKKMIIGKANFVAWPLSDFSKISYTETKVSE